MLLKKLSSFLYESELSKKKKFKITTPKEVSTPKPCHAIVSVIDT